MKFLALLRRPFSYKYYNVTLILIIICVVFFILQNITPITTIELFDSQIQKDVIRRINIITKYFALIPEEMGQHGYIWQIATYMFMHGGFFHILINMLILFMFGTQLEREFGSSEFLLFYFTVGIGAGIIMAVVYPLLGMGFIPVVGASGAIYGLLLAFATRHPNQPIYIWGILPVKAYMLLIIFTAIEIFSQVMNPASGVAHLGHLSGLIVGFLYFLVRFRINPITEIRKNIR
ncbi:MAG: rhomboid family intramembrane serine protease [Spirochaetales bacterium]|nr:rhomboid family intramembrane serine protease [Spirochaetales bacterium]